MKKFLEKRWWQGVGGIVGIIALVLVALQFRDVIDISRLAVSIALNIILAITLALVAIYATKQKRKYKDAREHIKDFLEKVDLKKFEGKRVFLPNSNRIWELNINNSLLTELHGQAYGQVMNKFEDAKLSGLSIAVYPYFELLGVSILFYFYSLWAGRVSTYGISERKDLCEMGPGEPVKQETDRVTFDELPWLEVPNWPQFLKKSCEKVGPLSPSKRTMYLLSVDAEEEPRWSIFFYDGVTGKEYRFSWDGKGDPIPQE